MILSVYDDGPPFCSAGTHPVKWVGLFINPPGVVATTNSIIGSVLITGLLKAWLDLSATCIICWGAVVLIAMFILHLTYQIWRVKETKRETKVLFPKQQ